ncbi:hypothetical protein [Elizabethkingia anophelis]|uniref:hypothetical protein n=1 Tax=Elizabethkingia anophelis TaxID=1117645 RepID=UPI0004E2EBF0|nr:hypothetical protein [Elizabethkingia anophelis]KFC33549.1 hypothetical protein FF18_08200 [Elizabethkingia anophelis]
MELHQKKFNLIKDLLISKLGERVKFSKEFDDETLEIEDSEFWLTANKTELIVGYGINHSHYSEDYDNLDSGIEEVFNLLTCKIRTTREIRGSYMTKITVDKKLPDGIYRSLGSSRPLFYPFWKKPTTEVTFIEKIINREEIEEEMFNIINLKDYRIERTCRNCNYIDIFPLSKEEAAFGLYNAKQIWETSCSECGSSDAKFTSLIGPKIDESLIELWGRNPDYVFYEQDEEILIAGEDNYKIILRFIDEKKFSDKKMTILICSLCILLYDNIGNEKDYTIEENKRKKTIVKSLLRELRIRKSVVYSVEENLAGYVKQTVFPLLDLNIDE